MSRTIPLQTFVLQHIAFLQTTHYSFRHLLFWQAPLCHQSRGCTSASALDAGVAAGFWLLRVPRAGASIHDCRIDVDGGVSWLRICWNVLTKFEDLCVLAVFLVLTSSCVSFRFMTDANTPGVEKISACTVPKAYLDSSYSELPSTIGGQNL